MSKGKTFSSYVLRNSITNNIINEDKLDSIKPFTFDKFLEFAGINFVEDNLFNNYEEYIQQWSDLKRENKVQSKNTLKQSYINLFSSLTLNYKTPEERRFFENINLNNDEDLNKIIPFFAKKIKIIYNYYKNKRNTFKRELESAKNKGTSKELKNYIKNKIYDLFTGDDIPPDITSTLPLSSFLRDIDVDIEEGYSVFNDYYDIDPESLQNFYSNDYRRDSKITSNVNNLYDEGFLNIERSILKLINEKNITLRELGQFSPTINFDLPLRLNLLERSDYIDYNNNDVLENIKSNLNLELTKKLMGTDYFYLSSNSLGQSVSGVLFEADNPVNNILNISYPTSLTIPITSTMFDRDIGLFYTPDKFSILKMDGPFYYKLKENLENNIYIYPNPDNYGNISNLSKSYRKSPFNFYIDDKVYKNKSSSFGIKFPLSNLKNQNFYSYSSKQQLYSVVNNLSSFDDFFAKFYNKGTVVSYDSDIYGNIFILTVNSNNVKYINDRLIYNLNDDDSINKTYYKNKDVYNNTTLINSNTILERDVENVSINPDINNVDDLSKNAFVYNIFTNDLKPLSSELLPLFTKYINLTDFLYDIQHNLLSLNVYKNIISVKTKKFDLKDSYTFLSGIFKQSFSQPFFIENNNILLSKISNDFVVDNNIYNIKILQEGFNSFAYEVYSYDIKNQKSIEFITLDNRGEAISYFSSVSQFNILSKIKRINNVKLSHSKILDSFTLTVQYSDLNENQFLNTVIFKIFNSQLVVLNSNFLAPENYFITTDFTYSTGLENYFYKSQLQNIESYRGYLLF